MAHNMMQKGSLSCTGFTSQKNMSIRLINKFTGELRNACKGWFCISHYAWF
jgi:hypothetical protein